MALKRWALLKSNPDAERSLLNKILEEIRQAISASVAGVASVVSGTGITVNNTDPSNPVVGLSTGSQSALAAAISALQPGDNITELTNNAGYTTNTGTVTSVGLIAPSGFAVTASPVTGSGDLAFTYGTGYTGYTVAEQMKLATVSSGASGSVTSVGLIAPSGFEVIDSPVTTSGDLSFNYASGYTGYTVSEQMKLSGIAAGATANTGTVTSVALAAPTGLTVSGSPVTTSGTLTLTFTSGYSIPTTAKQGQWDTAYTDRNKWDGGATGLTASTGRTSLGATTVGSNLFTLTNPSAITFPRINADNTVSALSAANFRTAIGGTTVGQNIFTAGNPSAVRYIRINADNSVSLLDASTFLSAIGGGGGGSGTVTSVAAANATGITWSGSPITTSGTLTPTLSANLQAWHAISPSTTSTMRSTSQTTPASGTGLEWYFDVPTDQGYVVAAQRGPLVWKNLNLYGLNVTLNPSGGTAQVNGALSATSTITDLRGDIRTLPRTTSALTLGCCYVVSAGFTLNTGLAAGGIYSIYNDSASAITLTQGSGLTLRLAGTTTTGNRTLAPRGMATFWCNSTTEYIMDGNVS